MKASSVFISCSVLVLSSCAYNDLPIGDDGFRRDYGCVNIIEATPGAESSALSKWDDVKKLLVRNKIPFDNLRLTEFDDSDRDYLGKKLFHVRALQFVNGFPVLRSTMGFHFREGVLNFTMGHRYQASIPALSVDQNLDAPIIRGLYFQEMKNYDVSAKTYGVSCLDIQFGYIDLNAGNSMLEHGNLVKAWFVKPAGGDYPEAIFLDDDGSTRYFFDGKVY